MFFTPIKPMLLATGNQAFNDHKYIFEPKWDGWRILIHKVGDRIEAYSRNGRVVSKWFPELELVSKAIKSERTIIDCEAICITDGKQNFEGIQLRGRLKDKVKISRAVHTLPVTFVAFDLLFTDENIMGLPLMSRKTMLKDTISPSDFIIPTMFVENDGVSLQELTIEKDWEGIVAKKKTSQWIAGLRTTEWLKIKNFKFIDAIILGYRTIPNFAFIVGVHFPTSPCKPIATVDKGIKPEEISAFLEIAKSIKTKQENQVQWLEPVLCCKVQYQEKTALHHLRIATFKGFLFGKDPSSCTWK